MPEQSARRLRGRARVTVGLALARAWESPMDVRGAKKPIANAGATLRRQSETMQRLAAKSRPARETPEAVTSMHTFLAPRPHLRDKRPQYDDGIVRGRFIAGYPAARTVRPPEHRSKAAATIASPNAILTATAGHSGSDTRDVDGPRSPPPSPPPPPRHVTFKDLPTSHSAAVHSQ